MFAWRVRFFLGNSHSSQFLSLEMHIHGQRCTNLIEVTANALSGDVVALMLMAVQRDNLELSVSRAIER